MITRLKVKNYRSIEEIDLTLSPLTVLVGKNGAGKSTILDVLAFVRDALSESLASAIRKRGGINGVRHWTPIGDTPDTEIALFFMHNTLPSAYYFSFGKSSKGTLEVKQEGCTINDPDTLLRHDIRHQIHNIDYELDSGGFHIDRSTTNNLIIDDNGHTETMSLGNSMADRLYLPMMSSFSNIKLNFEDIASDLRATEFYSISPEAIRDPQIVADDTELFGDGRNFGSVLNKLQNDKPIIGEICSVLGIVVPNLEDIRVTEAGGYCITELKHRHKDNAEAWFSLAHESDGTLRALGLLTALFQDYTHSLIGIEEPETVLYPRALSVIAEVLHEAAERRQVIVTTQSPDLISRFKADSLRVVSQVEGATTVGMLDSIQKKAIEEDLFDGGELMRIQGLLSDDIPSEEAVFA